MWYVIGWTIVTMWLLSKLGVFKNNVSIYTIFTALPFVGLTIFFGTKGGYYDSDDYNGDGCAHDVKR